MSGQDKPKDLLSSSLVFNKMSDPQARGGAFQIIYEVSEGHITRINDEIQQMAKGDRSIEISRIVNTFDQEGKTPLFYACYYNFQNLVLYLLNKGADSSVIAGNGQNVVHLCCFLGHLECLQLIVNYERHKDRMKLFSDLKQEMKTYYFKRTDVRNGVLVSPDKHNPLVQQRFNTFRQAVIAAFNRFLSVAVERLKGYISPSDEVQRNPIHYSSLNKFTKCHKTACFILQYDIEVDGYESFLDLFSQVSLLELNKEVRIDPRQYVQSLTMVKNFLLPDEHSRLLKGFHNQVKTLVKSVINAQDSEGYTPLHLASFYGDFASVQFYLTQGGDPKAIDSKNKKEVLDYASNNEVRKYLTDLKDAARKGDEKNFNFLVNCGQEVNKKVTIFGIAPIHNAIQSVHASKDDTILRSVVKCNADVNITDSNGWTSLHHACKNGDLSTVEYLVEEQANIFTSSSKGYQPIHVAAMFEQPKVVEFLLDKGAMIEALTVEKLTPLHLAAKKGNVESMRVLLDKGANIYTTEERLWTSLHFAAFYYHKNAVHLLQRYDADFEKLKYMKNCAGKIAKQIITNEETLFALNTLWNASREGNLDIVRRLTTLGQDINEQTIYNQVTPLMFAVQNQHYLIVKFLLDNRADKTIVDKDGKTALDYAYEVNNRKIIGLLDPTLN